MERELAARTEAQRFLRRLAIRRATIMLLLAAALGLFLWRLPAGSRLALVNSLLENRMLVVLLLLFGLIVTSLLWSRGQRIDQFLFQTLNLRGFHTDWLDRTMWFATLPGNEGFVALAVALAYVFGDHTFAGELALGGLTLWLLVTAIKAGTDRARPFNLLRETRVMGMREHGLSFPSGHTAQTFFMATLAVAHFQLPFGVAVVLYGLGRVGGIYAGLPWRPLSARCHRQRHPGDNLGNSRGVGSPPLFLSLSSASGG